MTRDAWIFTGLGVAFFGTIIGLDQYNKNANRKLKEKAIANEELYFSKLTPEQVEKIETQKLEVKSKELELKRTEAELKKTITDFKKDIQSDIQRTTNASIEKDMRRTFDDWATKYEDRLDKKLDRVVSRIDDLSDKYGGVKGNSSTPSIQVVNAPNN